MPKRSLEYWLVRVAETPGVRAFLKIVESSMATQPQLDGYWGFNFCEVTGEIHSIKFYVIFFTKPSDEILTELLDEPNLYADILARWHSPALPNLHGGITFALKIFADGRIKRGFYFRTRHMDLLTPPHELVLCPQDYLLDSAIAVGALGGQPIKRTYHYFQNTPAAYKIFKIFSEEYSGQRISYCETDGDIKMACMQDAHLATQYFLKNVSPPQFKEDILNFCSRNGLQIAANGRRLRSSIRTIYVARPIEPESLVYKVNAFQGYL